MNFGPQPPVAPRIDLDVKAGKALIEFATAETARLAWESDRLTGEGKEHVRAYWYRVPGIGADAGVGELEEGEIEDGELAKHFGQNNKTKTKESRKKATELAPLVTYSAAPVVQPLSSNGHRTSHPPVTPSSSTFSPVQSSFVTRHPTLPSAPPSLPPKPVSPAQHPPMKLVGLPPPPPHAPQADPPKPLLSRIQPTLSNPQEGAQTVPTPVQSAVSSLNATAPVFVPKAQPLSSASVSNEAAPPRSLDVPSVDKITDTSRSRLESDVSETTLAQTASDHVRVVPKAVREVVAGTIFESDQLSQEADIGPIVSSRDVSTPPAVSSPGGSSSSEAPAISSQPEAPSAAGRSLLPAKLKPDTKSQMQSVLAVSANQEVTIPVAVPSAKPSASSQPRDPRSALSTSTPPPSEPRATRNAPKVPSSAKRKEVEEMLSRHREELASRRSASSSGSTTPVSEIEAMIVGKSLSSTAETTPSPTLPAAVDAAAAIKEDDLRRLVLNSRKSRVVSAAPNTPPVESSPSFVASVTVNELKAAQDKLSLDELAVSFIAQSIQAVSMPSPALGSPDRSAPAVAPIFSEKALLSAKQQVLEGNIADQKALMNRYLAARTKAERDRLKQAMAQRSRYVLHPVAFRRCCCTPPEAAQELLVCRAMEQELGTLQARADAGKEAARALKFRWPETNKHACILVISDDEGEDSDD
ncbi:uncharacterized protein PHACADRAFT_251305 [Phanerochaete carnosa HHB-10118-sp]|uniref:Uncharacterized protein n=1 Tax=Phanerochaete carnosa (strain HHB-10118-sp) TaxID=650164 RepID=K5W168_PHACS|nr:uncharacterized protein PHACADRAFT_251305 [Phanerochaete carnosa HHB-10118-sp]EKM57598.1 hypothetical protein PHACADRAFT_251305 [Phanerochaete carnosa HHB-10118-sp]